MSTNTVIVFVPGYTGSQLNNASGNQVWPLTLAEDAKVVANHAELVTLLSESDLSPVAPILDLKVSGKPVYSPLVNYFTSTQGFTNVISNGQTFTPALTAANKLFVQFGYDWRRSNAFTNQDLAGGSGTAFVLNNVLNQIDAAYSKQSYNLYLLGHSMGGLVIRALLETKVDETKSGFARNWKSHLQGLVTFATPHLGAPQALAAVVDEMGLELTVSVLQQTETINIEPAVVQSLVDMDGYAGGYQLLPYDNGASDQWKFVQEGKDWLSLLSPDVQAALKSQSLNQANLKSATAFFNALNYDTSTPTIFGTSPLPYTCLYSTSYQDDQGNDGTTCYEFTLANDTLTKQASTDKGDSLVTPYSGSFGIDATSSDGSDTFAMSGVSAQAFSGLSHTGITQDSTALAAAAKAMGLSTS